LARLSAAASQLSRRLIELARPNLVTGTLADLTRSRAELLPDTLRLALAAAPLVVGLCVAASWYNSWIHDSQPQGRYLFVAVVHIAVWMWGTLPWEGPRLHAVRLASAAVLLVMCVYSLQLGIFLNPAFQT
jgi:hypothetical protein